MTDRTTDCVGQSSGHTQEQNHSVISVHLCPSQTWSVSLTVLSVSLMPVSLSSCVNHSVVLLAALLSLKRVSLSKLLIICPQVRHHLLLLLSPVSVSYSLSILQQCPVLIPVTMSQAFSLSLSKCPSPHTIVQLLPPSPHSTNHRSCHCSPVFLSSPCSHSVPFAQQYLSSLLSVSVYLVFTSVKLLCPS